MAICAKTQPDWYLLSHHDRYRRLNKVQGKWCRRPFKETTDYRGRTVCVDGTWISDIPSFYLSLGEVVNGPSGYFGGSLDALSDCLCGDFGVLPPLTIRLSHFNKVRKALDGRAWCRFHAEICRRTDAEDLKDDVQDSIDAGYLNGIGSIEDFVAVADLDDITSLVFAGYFGDGSPADVARWTATYEAALADEPFDSDEYGSYFAAILEVLKKRGAELVSEEAKDLE